MKTGLLLGLSVLILVSCAVTVDPVTARPASQRWHTADVVREKRIGLGMPRSTVEQQLGAPALVVTDQRAGRRIDRAEYVSQGHVWLVPGVEDTGIFPEEPASQRVIQPVLTMVYLDGLLVAIADHRSRTFAMHDALRNPSDAKLLEQLRDELEGEGR